MLDIKTSRDLVGYGRNIPDPKWPGGAKIAVQFVRMLSISGPAPSKARAVRASRSRSLVTCGGLAVFNASRTAVTRTQAPSGPRPLYWPSLGLGPVSARMRNACMMS